MTDAVGSIHDSPSSQHAGAKRPRLRWLDPPSTSQHIRRTGWELRPLPDEISRFPADLVIPDKASQILAWSVVPGSNWSFQPPPKCAPGGDTHNDLDQAKTRTGEKPEPSALKVSETTLKIPEPSAPLDARAHLPSTESSLKTKLFSKIGLNKSSERVQPIVPPKAEPVTAECTSCFDDLPEAEMIRLKSCRHWYCKECLRTLILTGIATEASFPPKCCLSPIPLHQILKALSSEQREGYKAKAEEYTIPASDRWYCPNTDCLKWIPGSKLKINKQRGYDCPHCATKLCRTCRGAAHPENTDCPQDFGLEAVLETADVEGWQRCYSCRMFVEHNTGCRHMTCRCGGEFCYVCGLRWQTCTCTEADAAEKRAGTQRRREERAAQQDEEAEEIARAIAEVEEMEREEAEERRREEVRRQAEEEEQLRALEALRLEEEARRKEEAEQAERDFSDALVRSFEEEWQQMERLFNKIRDFQFSAISLRHQAEDKKLGAMNVEDEEQAKRDYDAFTHVLARNSEKRRSMLTRKQKSAVEQLAIRHEEEEDDLFLQVQMRLRGKSNRESRMERMLEGIQKQHEEEKVELEQKQKDEAAQLEQNIKTDNEGLEKWYQSRIDQMRDRQSAALQKFGYLVGADRHYFEIVTERRFNMLQRHGQNSLDSIQAGQDPVGLSEYEASKTEPFLPELDDGEEGPSGIPRGPTVINTPHGPLKMERFFAQQISRVAGTQPEHLQARRSVDGNGSPSAQHNTFRSPIPGAFPMDMPSPQEELHPAPLQLRHIPSPPQHAPPPPPPVMTTPETLTRTVSRSIEPDANPMYFQQQQSQQINSIITEKPVPSPASTKTQPVAPQPSMKTGVTVTQTSPADDRRTSNASSLSAKKSKWGFLKPKELTEEEIKKRMMGTVGDACLPGTRYTGWSNGW